MLHDRSLCVPPGPTTAATAAACLSDVSTIQSWSPSSMNLSSRGSKDGNLVRLCFHSRQDRVPCARPRKHWAQRLLRKQSREQGIHLRINEFSIHQIPLGSTVSKTSQTSSSPEFHPMKRWIADVVQGDTSCVSSIVTSQSWGRSNTTTIPSPHVNTLGLFVNRENWVSTSVRNGLFIQGLHPVDTLKRRVV